MRHGAKTALCSSEGCINLAQRGGVCKRHRVYRNLNDASTAFASLLGSEFDKTLQHRPRQRNSRAATMNRVDSSSLPEEIVFVLKCRTFINIFGCSPLKQINYEPLYSYTHFSTLTS